MNIMLTADWHLRDDTPPCRAEDFMTTQKMVLEEIQNIIKKENVRYLLIAGDLFHKAKPSPYLLQWTIENMPYVKPTIQGGWHTIVYPGNHDLPYHNMEKVEESGLAVLEAAKKIIIVKDHQVVLDDCRVLMFHEFIYDKIPWEGCKASSADKFLSEAVKKYSIVDGNVVLVGDNHQCFSKSIANMTLVNPGCITVQRESEYATCSPSVFIYNTKTHGCTQKLLTEGSSDILFRTNREKYNEKMESRINKFVESLTEEYEIGLSFEDNVKKFITDNKIEPKVQKRIKEIIYND